MPNQPDKREDRVRVRCSAWKKCNYGGVFCSLFSKHKPSPRCRIDSFECIHVNYETVRCVRVEEERGENV